MIHPDLKLPRDEIAEFCRRHHIKTLSLFGSATRGDFRPDSDVDFLTEFDPEVSIGLAEYLDMEEKLAGIVGMWRDDAYLLDIIRLDIVWQVLQQELPKLIAALESLVPPEEDFK